MKNIENCLQGLKRQNKLLANTICVKKNSCISKKNYCRDAEIKNKFAEENFPYPSRKIMVRPLVNNFKVWKQLFLLYRICTDIPVCKETLPSS